MYSAYILSENYKKIVFIVFAFVLFNQSSWHYPLVVSLTIVKNMKTCRTSLILPHFTILDRNKNLKGFPTILQIMMG